MGSGEQVSHLVGLQTYIGLIQCRPTPSKLAIFFPNRLSKFIFYFASGITDHLITQALYSGTACASD